MNEIEREREKKCLHKLGIIEMFYLKMTIPHIDERVQARKFVWKWTTKQ